MASIRHNWKVKGNFGRRYWRKVARLRNKLKKLRLNKEK